MVDQNEYVNMSEYDKDRALFRSALENINKEFDRSTNAARLLVSTSAKTISTFSVLASVLIAFIAFVAYNIISINRQNTNIERDVLDLRDSYETIAESLSDAPEKLLQASARIQDSTSLLAPSLESLQTVSEGLATVTNNLADSGWSKNTDEINDLRNQLEQLSKELQDVKIDLGKEGDFQ